MRMLKSIIFHAQRLTTVFKRGLLSLLLLRRCLGNCDFVTVDLARRNLTVLGLTKGFWDKPLLLKKANLLPGLWEKQGRGKPVTRDAFLEDFGQLRLLTTKNLVSVSESSIQSEPNHTTYSNWAMQLGAPEAVNYSFHKCWQDPQCVQLVRTTYGIPDEMRSRSRTIFIAAGSESHGLSLHRHGPTWAIALAGEKTWFVAPGNASLPLNPKRHYPIATLAASGLQRCIQREFEIVVLPHFWWHATYNTAPWGLAVGGQDLATEAVWSAAIGNAEWFSFWEKDKEKKLPGDLGTNWLHPNHVAAEAGHVEVVEQFLQNDPAAYLNIRSEKGQTSIHYAAKGGHVDVMEILLHHRADVAALDPDDTQPMHEAAQFGHASIVELLARHGANVQAKDKGGWQPMRDAARRGHASVVLTLLNFRAFSAAADDMGLQPMHLAAQYGHVTVLSVLINQGVNVVATDNREGQPMHSACLNGHSDVVELLLTQRAGVSVGQKQGATPMHIAVQGAHGALVQLLASRKARIAASDKQGWQPMHIAAKLGHIAMVELLVSLRASVAAKDQQGNRPIHFAKDGTLHSLLYSLMKELKKKQDAKKGQQKKEKQTRQSTPQQKDTDEL